MLMYVVIRQAIPLRRNEAASKNNTFLLSFVLSKIHPAKTGPIIDPSPIINMDFPEPEATFSVGSICPRAMEVLT